MLVLESVPFGPSQDRDVSSGSMPPAKELAEVQRPEIDGRKREWIYLAAAYLAARSINVGIAFVVSSSRRLPLSRVLSSWDGGWYLQIAQHGYPTRIPSGSGSSAESALAFFPGYPASLGLLSVMGLPIVAAGVILSIIAGLAACFVVKEIGESWLGSPAGSRGAILLAVFPASFVLTLVYAEGLFVLLAALSLLFSLRSRWVAAGISAALAGVVRPQGFALAAALALVAVLELARHRSFRALIAPALATGGSASFFVYLWAHTGDPFAYFTAQKKGWGMSFDFGARNLHRVAAQLANPSIDAPTAFALVAIAVAGIAVYLFANARPPAGLAAYASLVLILTAMSSNITSIPRFVFLAFPLMLPVARAIPGLWFWLVATGSFITMIAMGYLVTSGAFPP